MLFPQIGIMNQQKLNFDDENTYVPNTFTARFRSYALDGHQNKAVKETPSTSLFLARAQFFPVIFSVEFSLLFIGSVQLKSRFEHL